MSLPPPFVDPDGLADDRKSPRYNASTGRMELALPLWAEDSVPIASGGTGADTTAAARAALDVQRKFMLDVRDFGAACDGVADDTEPIQNAVDAVISTVGASEVPSGTILIPGPCRITNTIVVLRKSIHFKTRGTGMGDVDKGALIWGGAADIPMMRLDSTLGCIIEMRFVGGVSNFPSAAIEIAAHSIATQPDSQSNVIRNTHIGPNPYWGNNVGVGKVKRGIHIKGTTGNDRLFMDNVEIKKPTVCGIQSDNYNSIWNQWDNVLIDGQGSRVPVAIQSAGGFQAANLNTNYCDICIDVATGNAGPEVSLLNHAAEKCYTLLKAGLDAHVRFVGGRFLLLDVPPGSDLIDWSAGMGFTGSLEMVHYHWLGMAQYFDQADPVQTRPRLYFNSTRIGPHVKFDACRGLRHTDIVTNVGVIGGITAEGSFNSDPLYGGVSPYTGTTLRNILRSGDTTLRPGVIEITDGLSIGATKFLSGTGSPEGAQTAGPGSVYTNRTDGGIWKKISGTGNTNWVELGAVPQVQSDVFTSSGTWNKPAWAKKCSFLVLAGGGGGGSGRRGAAASVRCGGGGGGGGASAYTEVLASALPSSLTVTVGAGGSAGAAVTVDDTSGADGGNGGTTVVTGTGFRLQALGVASGGKGGTATTGLAGSASALQSAGAGGAASASGGAGAAGTAGGAGGSGGGAGGGITSGNTAAAGGAGVTNLATGAAAGASGAIDANGTAGTAAVAAPWGGGSGGGGGASITTVGGTGGAGANYGAGGGGGGASLNGNNSGAGGAGAPGIVVIISEG